MLEIIEDIDGLFRLEKIWRKLEASEHICVFQTYLWCYVTWETFLAQNPHNQLWILHWSNDSEDIILPTYIDSQGMLRFIYDTDSDVCDGLYHEGRNHNLAYYEMQKSIQAEKRIKQVWFQKLRGDSEVLNNLGVLLRGGIIFKDNAFSWLLVEPSSDFIASQRHMKSKDRADLKCMRRQVSKYNLHIASAQTNDNFPAKELLELGEAMRKAGKRDDFYFRQDSIDFTRKIYDNGG